MDEQQKIAESAQPHGFPDTALPEQALSFRVMLYGMDKHHKLFTARQLVALTTFSNLVLEAREQVSQNAAAATHALQPTGKKSMVEATCSDFSYPDAVATYLAFAVDKLADTNSTLCAWQVDPPRLRATFGRQALPMTWDFAEAGIFADAAGDYQRAYGSLCEVLDQLVPGIEGQAQQLDAGSSIGCVTKPMIATDPPYYDNIGYADLSDYFYIWLRRSLAMLYPSLFSTLLTPKTQELIATPFRHEGSRELAQTFFEEGLGKAFSRMHDLQYQDYPLTVFYAFKQTETDDEDDEQQSLPVSTASTGWETMLSGLIRAGFSLHGTWPMRTERGVRTVGLGTNALASSIVLVCRPRPANASLATRKEFITSLRRELPEALKNLQHGNIAPVDLAQAAIGPGMAVFTRYAKVVESDGKPMTVRTALGIINQVLDEVLAEQEGDFDPDTRWALAWFEQFGTSEGPYGVAETLSKAKNTAINGLVEAGVVNAGKGKVQLLSRAELPDGWNPATDKRLSGWPKIINHGQRPWYWEGPPRGPST